MKLLAPIAGLTRLGRSPHATTSQWLLTRSMTTHYDTLGVKTNATNEDIKQAFVKLSKEYHPDVSSHRDSAEKFSEVAEAYSVLGNQKSKKIYDRVYCPMSSSGQTQANRTAGQHVHRSSDPFDSDVHNVRWRKTYQTDYNQMKFSSKTTNREDLFARATGLMAVTIALFLGTTTFILVIRKNTSVNIKARDKQALEMNQLVWNFTGKSANPTEKQSKLDKTTERLRQFKI